LIGGVEGGEGDGDNEDGGGGEATGPAAFFEHAVSVGVAFMRVVVAAVAGVDVFVGVVVSAVGGVDVVVGVVVEVVVAAVGGVDVVARVVVAAVGGVDVVVRVVVAAVLFGGIDGEKVEEAEDDEADATCEDHGLEDAVWWEVIDDAAGGVEVEHDTAPEEEEGDAEVVGEGAGEVHF
jgi:hypothetical protein